MNTWLRRPPHGFSGALLAVLTLLAVSGGTPVVAAQPNAAAAASAEPAVGNADRGRELFVRNGCFACHGYDGQGGSYTGPRLAPNPLPWQAIAVFIRNPRNLEAP